MLCFDQAIIHHLGQKVFTFKINAKKAWKKLKIQILKKNLQNNYQKYVEVN
jgi:hypothetical protein